MHVQIPMVIADSRIADLIQSATCGYWADEFTAVFKGPLLPLSWLAEYPDWVVAALTEPNKALVDLCYDRTIGIRGKCGRYTLNRDKIAAGLALLAGLGRLHGRERGRHDGRCVSADVSLRRGLFRMSIAL